jgi:hypothetical protein
MSVGLEAKALSSAARVYQLSCAEGDCHVYSPIFSCQSAPPSTWPNWRSRMECLKHYCMRRTLWAWVWPREGLRSTAQGQNTLTSGVQRCSTLPGTVRASGGLARSMRTLPIAPACVQAQGGGTSPRLVTVAAVLANDTSAIVTLKCALRSA